MKTSPEKYHTSHRVSGARRGAPVQPGRSVPAAPPVSDTAAAAPKAVLAYVVAVGATLVALAVTVLLRPFMGSVVFMMFWPAVIFVAAWGGRGPAFLASVLSVALVDFFVLPPIGTLALIEPEDLVPLAAFLAGSTIVSALTDRMRLAGERAAEAAVAGARLAEELKDQTRQLEEQAADLELHMEETETLSEELTETNQVLLTRTREAQESEQRIRSILEGITDPFVVYDSEWRFRYLNRSAERIFEVQGRPPEALHGEVLWDAFPDLSGSDVETILRRAARERRPAEREVYTPETGTWSEVAAYPLADGGIAVQWRDVTDRKRAEEAAHFLAGASAVLGSSLDYERTLADLAQMLVPRLGDWVAVDLLGPDGRRQQVAVAHVDPAKVEFVREINRRYPPNDEAPTGAMHVIRTGQPQIYSEIPEDLLQQGAQDAEHLRLIRLLGLRSAMIVPMRVQENVIGALTLVSAESRRRYGEADLSLALELARRAALAVENARLHRDALEARERAEEANRAKTEFLTVMSHELRTPLNAISGYVELISLGIRGPITPEQREDLERIARSQRHLLALINDVLNYARLEGAHVAYKIESVTARALIEDIEPLVRPQLIAKDLSFEIQPLPDDLVFHADREKARQVLLNVLSNAVKFTPSGGVISIEARRAGGMIEIDVCDTGVGIPADKLEAIFEPFVQVGRTLTSASQGTGLGLAISRDLARGMHGDLRARSTEGAGSTFTLSLPSG